MPPRKALRGRETASRRSDIFGAVLGSGWGISPQGLELVFARAEQALQAPSAVDSKPSDGVDRSWQLTKRDGVAQLRVYGPLVSSDSWMRHYFAAYQDIAQELHVAMTDPSITSLVLTISSPGGHVTGCQELAQIIASHRGTKPIVAFVEGDACSAAYWLASACDAIVAAETAVLGCLGVQVAYLDDSKLLENWGLREIVVTSSQTPEKNRSPVDDAGRAAWQQMVDDLADVFLGAVAANRKVERSVVDAQFGRGAVLVGKRAVDAGLADRLGTYEALHAELASGSWRPPAAVSSTPTPLSQQESTMPKLKQIGAARRPAPVAAAFEANAEVRALVTRDVGIAEGDVGTVTEVRDGSFYRVAVGESDEYAWLAEDELELATAADSAEAPADQSDEPAASDDETDDEEQPAARRAKPSAFQSAIQAARTAERQRITGILALRTKASVDALLTLCNDPRCTPEAAAHRLLTGKVQGARTDALGQLAGDEAALQAAGGLSAVADGAQPPTDAQRIIATTAQFNPRAIARKPRG
jgi:capsid assembly protease